MQKILITKPGDLFEGREGLAEVITGGVVVYFDGDPKFRIYSYNEFKVTGKAAVYAATRLAFNQQRDIFNVMDLIRAVRRITNREYLMDGTILRRLRELRADGRANYKEYETGKYRKL
jgi:hypothetical protein